MAGYTINLTIEKKEGDSWWAADYSVDSDGPADSKGEVKELAKGHIESGSRKGLVRAVIRSAHDAIDEDGADQC